MVCKKCGVEMEEEALFCGKCGYRLDGKTVCKSCGKTVEGHNAFCIFCGASLTESVTKKKVPTATPISQEGKDPWSSFEYGTKNQAEERPKERLIDKFVKENTEKTFSDAGSILLLIGAVLSLFFVFFIGFGFTVTNLNGGVDSELAALLFQAMDEGKGGNIFYFFGKYQKLSGGWDMYAVFGLLLTLGILAAVVLCVFFAIVAYKNGVLYEDTREKQNANIHAIAAIVGYLAGIVVFYSYTRQTALLGEIKETTSLNLATKIGIVLTILACVFGVGLCMLGRGREYWETNGNSIFWTIVALGLVVVALIFSANAAFNVTIEIAKTSSGVGEFVSESYTKFALDMGYSLTNVIGRLLGGKDFISKSFRSTNNWAQINLLCFIIVAAMTIRLELETLVDGESYPNIIMAVAMIFFSGMTLIFTMAANGELKDVIKEAGGSIENFGVRLSAHIFCLLFSIAYLALQSWRIGAEKKRINLEAWIAEQRK